MQSKIFGFLAGMGLLGLAGFAGYEIYPSDEPGISEPGSATQSTNIRIEPLSQSDEQTLQSKTSTELATIDTMKYVRWYADEAANGQLKACIAFNYNVATGREVELQPYIEVSPTTPTAIIVSGKSLCLGGLSYDQDYTVRVKEGLPSEKSDIALAADQSINIAFGDKPAFVGFTDNGIILPKTETGGLAIETVNVTQLDIIIERVNHRILSQTDPSEGSQALEGEYSYDYEAWQEKVEVWSDSIDIANRPNETVRTIFPLQKVTTDLGYGAYIVTAKRSIDKDDNSRVAQAWRWIISTDMALTSYRGSDAMHVNVRSLKTAELVNNVRLDLIARNNDLLGQVETGSDGRAKFPAALFDGQGNDSPKMILAYGPNDDFAMLDLARSPLDMTAYDVEGRIAQGPIDIFAYTERGVYRPGEIVYLTSLLRGGDGTAFFDRPLNVTITKPDGGVAFKQSYDDPNMAGALAIDYELPVGAPRGLWSFTLNPEGTDFEKTVRFDVQDFVPQKLKVSATVADERLTQDSRSELTIQSDFLYGAPGAALGTEAEGRVQIENQPFAAFKDYQFGDTQETFEERIIEIGYGVTDNKGTLSLPINLRGEDIGSTFPLRLMVTSGVAEPGGRYVRKTQYVPLRTQDSYIGFKPGFEGSYASHKQAVDIDLVHVSDSGEVLEGDVEWRLFEEIHDFQWYRENGRWRYRKDVSEVALFSDALTLSSDPVTWSRRLPRGQYRLDALSSEGIKGSIRFNVGWARPGSGVDAPDRIVMGKVEETVSVGQTITLSVDAPYAGKGDLVIANEEIKSIQSVILPEGESELTFKFNKSWGDSVYAMLTLYTPEDETGQSIQRRAAGMSYIALDRSDQTLSVNFDVPETIEPRQTYNVEFKVDNVPSGEAAWVSLAAVDEGILQLTQFETPDAAAHYFGKKAFSLDVRDDYARLLNPNLGLAAILPQGGDSVGGAGLSVVPERTVSLYQGPVKIQNGKASIPLEIPDFQGQLRLMAMAWSKTAVGSGEQDLIVRDPVPVTVGLPRFLAPGDTAVATVSLDNLDGPIGDYQVQTTSSLLANAFSESFLLERGIRRDISVPIRADELGVSNFDLNISGPQNYAQMDMRQIEVRSPFRPRVQKRLTQLAPGETYTLSADRLEGFIPQATDVMVSVSNLPGLEAQTYLQALSVYPYGCTEQTTSRAMPLLFVDELGGIKGLSDTQRRARIDLAIKRLVARQDSDGAFGLWRVGDGNSSPWLQIYVTEFLLLAKERGQTVPDDAIKRALSAVSKISEPDKYSNLNLDFNYGWTSSGGIKRDARQLERAAYAHYVLAIAGKVDVPDLRYMADNQAKDIRNPLASSYLATALSKIGDERRAKVIFEQALKTQAKPNADDYYASDLRDASAFVAIAHKFLSPEQLGSLVQYVANATGENDYLNTQEQSYLIRMIAALGSRETPIDIEGVGLDFTVTKASQTATLVGSQINGEKSFINKGDSSVWVSETLSGLPTGDPGRLSEGYVITKEMLSISGDVLSNTALTKGERAIIRVNIKPERKRSAMIVLADLLPAGLEIESILTPEETTEGMAYSFVGQLSDLDLAEARDDRLVVSDRLSRWDNEPLVTAYIVRAVTEGDFIFPGAVAEDMYRPEIRGRTAASRLKVTGSGTN